jgi:ferric-dicitrate binding protein FerR (iron transport regulator)
VDTSDNELMGQVRLQALRRFLEIHRSPEDRDKLRTLAQWLEQCPTHRRAFRELGQALAKVAEDPDVLETALEAMCCSTAPVQRSIEVPRP